MDMVEFDRQNQTEFLIISTGIALVALGGDNYSKPWNSSGARTIWVQYVLHAVYQALNNAKQQQQIAQMYHFVCIFWGGYPLLRMECWSCMILFPHILRIIFQIWAVYVCLKFSKLCTLWNKLILQPLRPATFILLGYTAAKTAHFIFVDSFRNDNTDS